MLAFSKQGQKHLLKVGVYGNSGEGKTYLACTCPNPLNLLFEPQGFATVKLWAQRNGKPIPPTVLLTSEDDFDLAMRVLMREKERPIARLYVELNKGRENDPDLWLDEETLKKAIASIPHERPEWVTLDSTTELAWAIEKQIEREAPPAIGKDGLPAKTMRHSNVLRDRFVLAMKKLRDVPYNVLQLALRDDKESGEGEERTLSIQPSLPMKKMGEQMTSTLNAVGILRRERVVVAGGDDDDERDNLEVRRVVRFNPLPSYIRGKAFGDLGVEEPDVSTWIDKLQAAAEAEATAEETDSRTDKQRKKNR